MDEAADKSWPWCLRVLLARLAYHVCAFFAAPQLSAPDTSPIAARFSCITYPQTNAAHVR